MGYVKIYITYYYESMIHLNFALYDLPCAFLFGKTSSLSPPMSPCAFFPRSFPLSFLSFFFLIFPNTFPIVEHKSKIIFIPHIIFPKKLRKPKKRKKTKKKNKGKFLFYIISVRLEYRVKNENTKSISF